MKSKEFMDGFAKGADTPLEDALFTWEAWSYGKELDAGDTFLTGYVQGVECRKVNPIRILGLDYNVYGEGETVKQAMRDASDRLDMPVYDVQWFTDPTKEDRCMFVAH